MDNDQLDTSMVTKAYVFAMALDIAKKREDYTPVKKTPKEGGKGKNSNPVKTEVVLKVAATAAAAAKNAIDLAADSDSPTDSDSDGDGGAELAEIDRAAQEMRAGMKQIIEDGKHGKRTSAKKKRPPLKQGKTRKATKKPPTKKKKTKPAKKKTKKKPAKKKPVEDEEETEDGEDDVLQVGMQVMGKWCGDDEAYGDWFQGKIVSVNKPNQTAHVKYDDGDEDTELSWNKISILD